MDSSLQPAASSTIPSELTGPLPRRLQATGSGQYFGLLAPALLAVAVAAALWGGVDAVQQMQRKAALRRDSSEIVGEISRMRKGKSSGTVYYTFTSNGIAFTGKAEVPGFLQYSLRGSSILAIRYLPANPDVNHPAAWEWSLIYWHPLPSDLVHLPDFSSDLQLFFGLLILGAPGLVFFMGLRSGRKLLAEGLPTVGLVTKCTPGTRGSFLVRYEFHTEDGKVANGSCGGSRKEIGAKVCVIYLPQNPQRNMTYPSSYYRVVQ